MRRLSAEGEAAAGAAAPGLGVRGGRWGAAETGGRSWGAAARRITGGAAAGCKVHTLSPWRSCAQVPAVHPGVVTTKTKEPGAS